jgi:hypothetical protein
VGTRSHPENYRLQFWLAAIHGVRPRPIADPKIFECEFALAIAKHAITAKAKQGKLIVSRRRFDTHNQVFIPTIRAVELCRRFGHGATIAR